MHTGLTFGLQDNNDDRSADNNNIASAPGVRRDRYLVGDTMRNEVKVFVSSGILESLNFRLFIESMTSDFGVDDGDEYDIADAQLEFVNLDTTKFVSAKIIFKTISGEQYTCPISVPLIRSDQHLYQVAEPNIRPPQIIDVLASMFDQYDISFDSLVAKGCVPQNFVIGAGDSVIFQADYKFTSNFTPLGSNIPPLINFRSSICDLNKGYAWKLDDYCSDKPLSQFSGYMEVVNPAVQIIEPCAQSTEVQPFRYDMIIARPNMFPFEVRPLSTVQKYSYSLPTSVDLLESKLNFLRLQDNVQLFGVTPLTPGFNGDSLTLNLDPYFENPLDEGYSFEISTRFDTTCGYSGAKFGRTVLGLEYANMCFHDPVQSTYYIANPNGYQSGSPQLDFSTADNIIYLPTADVLVNFILRNNSIVDAPNAWMSIESDGDLADVQLLLMPGQTPVQQIGGVYQFGDLANFQQLFLRVTARNLTCRPVKVTFRFGWDCAPVFNANSEVCGSFSKTIELRPQPPELELVIVNQPPEIPMCGPSPYFEFEISNANDGSAYDIGPSIKLPPGMRIQPGSAQLSYPAGTPYINLTNPVQLPGNIWQFDPESSSGLLLQNGLVSADQEPLNALRIRFRVIAECGVVANAQPIYGAQSLQSCGINSNILRKPGMPVGIEGVEPTYSAVSNLQFSNPPGGAGCGQEVQLSVSIAVNDIPTAGDSIYILLPVGTSYVNGSYDADANAPSGPPQVSGQQLQLPLPVNIAAGTVLGFTFEIRYDDPAGCLDRVVILQTREKSEAFCATSNELCDIYIATGESLLNLNAQNPELQLNNFELNTQGTQTTFNAVLENAGVTPAVNPVIQLYHDLNGNGQIDAGEPQITETTAQGTLQPGAVFPVSGPLNNLPASAFCDLIARIPADENCACSDRVFPLDGQQSVTKGIGLCELQSVNVSTDSIAGNAYNWLTSNGLSCINCASATYTPGPEVQPGDMVTLVLQEIAGGDCVLERRFEIQFGGAFGIETANQTICAGEPVTLEATAGGVAYQWSGNGISNPNQQIQVVQPGTSSSYLVTVTFSGGCVDTGMVMITVNETDTTRLLPVTICQGTSATIFGQATDVAGIYTLPLQNLQGCDSIITQELIVTLNNIAETRFFCPGGMVEVFDSTFTTPGIICETTTINMCPVTTCVTVKEAANPQVPEQDMALVIQFGESVIIDTPNDYEDYEWTPTAGLTCADDPNNIPDCPDPAASPDSSTTFILVVTDDNKCRDTVEYRVFVCDEKAIQIPNAFTPNGDGANDVFRVVPHEGAEIIISLRVYSRWGEKVYEGSGPNAQWDGTIDNKPAPSDVYVWVLDYECGGKPVRENKDVTLLR